MTPTARWGALALLLVSFGARALGLGDIELRSALNQPLEAEIELVSATPEELSDLRASLASPETFDRYGLEHPTFLGGIDFRLGTDNLGSPVILVRSQEVITEPFITMLVEAVWSRGRLLREYTVLLDPPVLLPLPAVGQSVQPAETGTSGVVQPAAPVNRPAPEPVAAPSVQATPSVQTLDPVPTAAPLPATGSYGPVQSAETLWSIAQRYRPEGITMNQMIVAIYRANAQAFGSTMNTLHQGATLRIPQLAEASDLTATVATQEVLRQSALWREGGADQQARLTLVTPDRGADAEVSSAAGGDSASSEAAEVVELEGELDTLRDELDDSRRLLEIRDQQLQDLQAQLAAAQEAQALLAEQAVEQAAEQVVETGVDLESEVLFADEAQPTPATSPAIEEPAVIAPPAAIGQVVTTPSEPALISRVLGWLTSPILLIALGLAALIGAAVWYLRSRQHDTDDVTGRWEALQAESDDDGETSADSQLLPQQVESDEAGFVVEETQEAAPEPLSEPLPMVDFSSEPEEVALSDSSPDQETLTIAIPPAAEPQEDTLSNQTVIDLEQADPVAEADFHMAYGLYDQAAELVSKALEADPGRRDLRLKLLEVFFVWGNKESFLETAKDLQAEIGSAADSGWDKVVIMGKQICPDDAIFSAATYSAGAVDVDFEADDSSALDIALDIGGDSSALDLALDDSSEPGVDLDLGELGSQEVDFELEATGTQETAEDGSDLGDRLAAGQETVSFKRAADARDESSSDPDLDSLAATQESPTIETPSSLADELPDLDLDSTGTPDSLTIEQPDFDPEATDRADPLTIESPLSETDLESTGELPTVGQPTVSADTWDDTWDPRDRTAEIDLDDLGLDIENLAELAGDAGILSDTDDPETEVMSTAADDILSSSEVSEVLEENDAEALSADETALGDDDATLLAMGHQDATPPAPGADDSGESMLDDQDATLLAPDYSDDLTDSTKRIDQPATEDLGEDESLDDLLGETLADSSATDAGIEFDLDDLGSALEGGDTVEQPVAESTGSETPADDASASPRTSILDPHTMTMTEVGTKLDLARAYVDMGDLDGARSILGEVLEEGDSAQQKEAQDLIDDL